MDSHLRPGYGDSPVSVLNTAGEPIYKWIMDSNVLAGLMEGIADLFAGG